MATGAVLATQSQASISPLGRILGMFFSPNPTFQDIVRKPSWIVPVALMLVFAIGTAVGINQKMNWREYVAQQIEKRASSSQLSAEQKEKQIEAGAKFAPFSVYLFGIPAPIMVVLVVALVMWGAYNLLGGANTDYKTSLGIVAHAFVPTLLGTVLFLIVLFAKPPGTLDLNNPVATNVAAFLPDDTPKWLDALCKNIDIFVLWALALMAIGFALTNPKKLKGGKSFTIAASVFVFYLVVRVGLAFVFS